MRIGILGGGQLGRMMALAGYPLGLRFLFLDPSPEAAAGQVAELLVAAYDDRQALGELARRAELVTYEFENVPTAALRTLGERVCPPVRALEVAQDRLEEKRLFRSLGIPTAAFAAVGSREELERGVEEVGLPAVLKSRRFGYDGRGQALLRDPEDLAPAWSDLAGRALLLEAWVPFERELSILAVRGRDGLEAFYPLVENHHREGILWWSLAPAPGLGPDLQARAEGIARAISQELSYVGVLAVELFLVGGRLLANEMAPRVHNSGHWTIEGAETSQFENHLRAVVGMPLGRTGARGASALLNLIGGLPQPGRVLEVPGAHLHLYGKAARPGRKLGHVTVCRSGVEEARAALGELRGLVPPPDRPPDPARSRPSPP